MSKYEKIVFCELPETPHEFNIEKFKTKDTEQIKLYKDSKAPRRKKLLTYAQVTDKDRTVNYARVVPKGCIFIDYDTQAEAKIMREIIIRSKLKCLMLETTKGYHFLFRTPKFYKKEMTKATNWFGYQFDTKATTDTAEAVQIMRVCGIDRKEVYSWDLYTPITPDTLNIEKLDVLPYWLWGKLRDADLHKKGKPGESEYTLTDTPFTQLMKLEEGSRHNHIVERCSYFALSNGFEMQEFKDLINAIHDQYLVKIGTPMSDSDLFGDLHERWEDYKTTLTSEGWEYREEERKWVKVKSKKDDKIDERRAAEYLFKQFDFYGINPNADGTFKCFLYIDKDGVYNYQRNVTKIRKVLKDHSNQNFKDPFFKEVEVQLMQLCAEHNKIILRTNKYIIVKNKVLSCITPDTYDFLWLGTRPPTDVVLPWNWYSREWVEEHKDDLGKQITWFIEQLSRNSRGVVQPKVVKWLWVIAGASMIPSNNLQKIIILSGGGQNGKSLFTSLIKLCLGEDMFNTSKIFDSSPHNNKFWGKDLDKGICCIVDDMPRLYNRDALSYIKGAVTGTDTVEINEKFKPKKRLEVLPQIIACTNFDFELYDTSEGMKRRVKVLPTECYIPDDIKDVDLQYKLVLNTTDTEVIEKYKMSNDSLERKGEKVMNMYTGEKGVLNSLDNGSLAWFANKARYMYLDWLMGTLKLEDSEEMTKLFEHTFENNPESQCTKFIKWYLESICGDIEVCKDLSPANCFFSELYEKYTKYCETEGLKKMRKSQFNKICSNVITKSGYQIRNKKNEKNVPYRYIWFG